jgi:hypothetical protein
MVKRENTRKRKIKTKYIRNNKKTNKYRKNNNFSKPIYNMKPIYGGSNSQESADYEDDDYDDDEDLENKTVSERLKYDRQFTNKEMLKKGYNGLKNSIKEVSHNMGLTNNDSYFKVDERNGHKPPINISKTLGSMPGKVGNMISKYRSMRKPEDSNIQESPPTTITEEEKEKVIEKLYLLNKQNQISEIELQHAIEQLNKRDGVLSMSDSIVSTLAPLQSTVKIISDFFVKPVEPEDINGRQTVIKLLKFPSAAKTFVKGTLKDSPLKDSVKDIELDEYLILVKDSHNSAGEKISSDLLGVDNLIANVINGCIGAGCKDGKLHPDAGYEKIIEVVDNTSKKKTVKLLEQRKKEKMIENQSLSRTGRYHT